MAVFTIPFTTPANYTYDSTKIEVSGGLATLKENLTNVYGRWHMNESSGNNVPDDSGNLRDGTTINAPTWVSGKLNNCLSLNGSTQYVDCGDIANFDRTNTFSVEAWIRTNSTQDAIAGRALRSGLYTGWLVWLDASGYLEAYLIRNVPGGDWIQVRGSTAGLNDNAWHHIAMTYNGSSNAAGIQLYVDGVLETPTSLKNSTISLSTLNGANFNIGGVGDGVDAGILWNGRLDETGLYDKVLSSSEVAYRYNSNSGREDFIRFSNKPTIYKTAGDSAGTIYEFNNFAVIDGVTEGSKGYQLSEDGITWYYWSGAAWVVAGANDYNTAAVVNTNINSFSAASNAICVKIFLISNGFQREEIDEIQITYSPNANPLVDAGTNKQVFDNLYLSPFSDATFTDPDGCYSEDTEVLTENGWKLLKKVVEEKEKIKIATLNPVTHLLEYEYPVNYFEYDYMGKMLHLKGGSIDCLVTHSHNVYLRKRDSKKWEFIKAKDIKFGSIEYKKDCNWEGKEQEYFFIPSITHTVSNKYSSQKKSIPDKQVKMDDWLRFFGIWLAEGSVYYTEKCRSKAYRILKSGKEASWAKLFIVSIAQNNKENRELIRDWVKKAGFNCCENGNKHSKNIVIFNKQLVKYLMPIKGAKNKYIPNEFKKLSKRQLWILFDSMMLGDGHKGKTWFYSTSSRQLAYDFEEIALKLGFVTNVSIWKGNYRINLSKKQLTPGIRKRSEWVNYVGKVYCLEVPNHLMYVRRNGKAVWSGNSVDLARYKIDGEIDIWTNIPQGGFGSLEEAVQAFSYQFNNSGVLTARLQVEDNIGATTEDSLTITVKKYTKTVNVRDVVTNEHILNFDFNSGDGSGTVQQDSPFTWSWDYGNFDTVIEKIFFYVKQQTIMVMDESAITIYMQASAFLNQCVASIGLLTEDDRLSVMTWLQQGGEAIETPTFCSVILYDQEDVAKYSDSTSIHDHGHFNFSKIPSGLENEGVYHLEVVITAGGVDFKSIIPVGLIERKLISFEGVVHINVDNGEMGTGFPKGTPLHPVNNWADAKVIADINNLTEISILGDLIISAGESVAGYTLVGKSPLISSIQVNGGNTLNTTFKRLTISGGMNGLVHIDDDSEINGVSNFEGEIHSSGLILPDPGICLALAGSGASIIVNCWSEVPGAGTPVIDMGGSGRGLNMRAYSGGIKLINKTGSESVTLEFIAGQYKLDSTIINGYITIRGIVKKGQDDSGPGCTVDTTAAVTNRSIWAELLVNNDVVGSFGKFLQDLGVEVDGIKIKVSDIQIKTEDCHDEAFGKWYLDPNLLTLTYYRKDGSVLQAFDLNTTRINILPIIGRVPQ